MIKFFKKIYYSVWADAINYERIKNGGEDHWKIFTLSYMSILLSINIATILSAILYFTNYDLVSKSYDLLTSYLSKNSQKSFLWYIIILLIPSIVITYYTVFLKEKYRVILEKYKFKNGRLIFIYFCITFITFFGFSLLNKFG
ncbi:hypothetical protein NHF50_07975 [Flavobacterium sp. NRK F10]|uniref:hypothetical protein n=1 Tax=Flavobacterium sp. NRK F10 TaxID=2954931 RepID=UPI0020911443|nr:hypothetical protein [Flavobacterium sp. NRK F10]MCO6174983.1 hypothetical protein [Flavobacterium sp. NRK F10]